MNQLLIGFSSLLLFLSFSVVKAQEITSLKNEEQNILQAIDTLFSPAANSNGHQIILNSDLEILKSTISLFVGEKSKIKDTVLIQRVDTVYLEARQAQNANSIILGSGNMDFIWVLLAVLSMMGCVFLIFLNFKNKRQKKDSTERLKTIETEFERHKKNSIDRERRLMRDLIDARKAEE